MRKLKSFIIFSVVVALAGCVIPPEQPQLTPLQIQQLQTREFEHDKGVVFASVLSVFQDLGYIVKSADKDTGFITAESPSTGSGAAGGVSIGGSLVTGVFDSWVEDIGGEVVGGGITYTNEKTAATAFIETIGTRTRVRLNLVLQEDISSSHSRHTDRQDTPILDPKIYQNAFDKIDNAIFVRAGAK